MRTCRKARAKDVGRPFLLARHACGGDTACIGGGQSKAVMAWRSLGAPISLPNASPPADDPMPETIVACAQTRIPEIADRLMGEQSFESGTNVLLPAAASRVSYKREAPVIRWRVGDPVSICLVDLPSNCLPGDDRCRAYQTTNQRTGQTRNLPDAADG